MAVNIVNPKADVLRRAASLSSNCNAARGLQELLKSNLGPRGTLKMLVGGAGQIKITKDGNVLLQEMQIQHPTASMIARAATAQDEMTGDGTTSTVLITGEIMKLGERHCNEGIHPRILCTGIDMGRKELLRFLDSPESQHIFIKNRGKEGKIDKEILLNLTRTALRTKLQPKIADILAPQVLDAVLTIQTSPEKPIDLFMIEIMHMVHRSASETKLVKGIVMDHGCRHPDMPEKLEKCFILTLNVSLEYEKSEVNSGFFYQSVEQRDRLVEAERSFTDIKVKKIIDLKRQVCDSKNRFGFVVLNQKGIDPLSLDLLAKEGIMALRRVKRRNLERLVLFCGGEPVNCVEGLLPADLGFAETVYQQTLGEEKYTFVEGSKNPHSCTILIKGPNEHTIAQIKDALRDGLRAMKNGLEDDYIVAGAGAFEIACYSHLQDYKKSIPGKVKYGIDLLAEALLSIPKTLASNSGLDPNDCILAMLDKYNSIQNKDCKIPVGIDLQTGAIIDPETEGIFDNYKVKRQLLSVGPSLAQNLLQVDEIIRAGKSMGGK